MTLQSSRSLAPPPITISMTSPLSPNCLVFAELVYNPITNYLLAGWSAVPEEKASRYRLSIKDVQPQDSGTYTCASPRGLTNSIIIVVAGNSYSDKALRFMMDHSHSSSCFDSFTMPDVDGAQRAVIAATRGNKAGTESDLSLPDGLHPSRNRERNMLSFR